MWPVLQSPDYRGRILAWDQKHIKSDPIIFLASTHGPPRFLLYERLDPFEIDGVRRAESELKILYLIIFYEPKVM